MRGVEGRSAGARLVLARAQQRPPLSDERRARTPAVATSRCTRSASTPRMATSCGTPKCFDPTPARSPRCTARIRRPAPRPSSRATGSTCTSATWAPRRSISPARCSGARPSSNIRPRTATAVRRRSSATRSSSAATAQKDPFVAALDAATGARALENAAQFAGAKALLLFHAARHRSRRREAGHQPRQRFRRRLRSRGWPRNLARGLRRRVFRRPAPRLRARPALPQLGFRSARRSTRSSPKARRAMRRRRMSPGRSAKARRTRLPRSSSGDEVYFVSDAGIATCADARHGRGVLERAARRRFLRVARRRRRPHLFSK